MKVAMLTHSTKARGGVVHGLKLAERLKALGADVTIYALAHSDDRVSSAGFFRPMDVPFEVFTFEWHPDLMVRLERMIAAYASNLPTDADVYHAQDCVGGTALARMKSAGVITGPVFRTVHHVDDFAEPRLYEFEKRAVVDAEHRFVVSEYWRKALAKDYGLESTVTYNGIDVADMSPLVERSSGPPTVLFVGGLEARKGLEFLVLALADIVREIEGARLVVVAKAGFKGTDDRRWFEVLAERAGVSDEIEFHESVPQEQLRQMYSDSDVVALPSRMEGWGLSLMEAMACRIPVVATGVGGVPELVSDGVEGFLVPPGDPKALAGAIVRLLKDPSLRDRMGMAGSQKVLRYSWDETARTVMDAYEEALSPLARTPP